MSKKVLLLHGWGGSEYPHWQSWLAGELAKDYGCVNFLKFSDYDHPKLSLWKAEALKEIKSFQPDIVVCHSLANTLWFHLCNEDLLDEVPYLYLVAPPSLECSIEELKEFFPVETPKKLYAEHTRLVYSTNDPYMDLQEAENLQKKLGVGEKVIENGGHLNADSDFGKWPWILEDIKAIKL
ncbi:MAG: alpha/beta hydrolase [Sulfurimonas sp.]